MIIPFPM